MRVSEQMRPLEESATHALDGLAGRWNAWLRRTDSLEMVVEIEALGERVTCANRSVITRWSRTPIAPGQTARLEVTYNPAGHSGDFSILIDVLSSASSEATALVIKGSVKPNPNAPTQPIADFSPDQWTFVFG